MNSNSNNGRGFRRNNAPATAPVSSSSTMPAVNTNDEALTELANCCICFETYNRGSRAPILIPCGHTFCKECADKIVTENVFFCCNCRTVSLLGFGGLSRNADLIQLLETLNLLGEEEAAQRPPARTYNKVTDEVYRAVPLVTFDEYCRSFFNLATRYLEFRIGARAVRSNQTVIQKVREAVNEITTALPSLQSSIKKLIDAPLNRSGAPSMDAWDGFYRPRLNATETVEYPFRIGARTVRSNQMVIQKVREAITDITAALPSLQSSVKKLIDAPLNQSGSPSMDAWDGFYRPRLNATETIEYPVFLPARNGSSGGATSSASSSTSSSTSAPRRNRPKKKRNPAPIPQRRTIDWDVAPSHLDF
uniref:RING-type domain-containing protein n=1 Tax=Panagrellus redivivus TaxID=6233 RepID=A0A7E4VNE5_PANRE